MNRSARRLFAIAFLLAIPFSAHFAAAQTAPDENDYEALLAAGRQKFTIAVNAWRTAADPQQKAALWKTARETADHLRLDAGNEPYPEEPTIEEVALGAPKSEKEIKFSGVATKVSATIVQSIPYTTIPGEYGAPDLDWVARRISADRFEIWSGAEGWLFDATGKLINQAHVPRRDGKGLEWFGAFLPDGRWVTTDLWSRDDTLYLFSREGKYLKELATRDMFSNEGSTRKTNGMINWARSDAKGQGWILSAGDYGGKALHVDEDLNPRLLNAAEPWKLSYPRQLGARYGRLASDDGVLAFSGGTAGHGPGVGHYGYQVWKLNPQSQYMTSGEGETLWIHSFWWKGTGKLGFWPGSYATYVDVGRKETWFFNEAGDAQGWIAARQLDAAADGKAMLFRDAENRLLTLGPDLRVAAARQFVDSQGATLRPMTIFDDLHLGLLMKDRQLVLASWPANP